MNKVSYICMFAVLSLFESIFECKILKRFIRIAFLREPILLNLMEKPLSQIHCARRKLTYPLQLDHFTGSDISVISNKDQYYVHCRIGYRSTVACSLLHQKEYRYIVDFVGILKF